MHKQITISLFNIYITLSLQILSTCFFKKHEYSYKPLSSLEDKFAQNQKPLTNDQSCL